MLGNSISVVTDFNDYLYYNTTPSVCNFRDKAMSVTPSKSAAACFSLLNVEVSTGTSTSTPAGPIGHDLTLTTGTESTNSSPTSIISSTNKPSAGHVLVFQAIFVHGPGLGVHVLGFGGYWWWGFCVIRCFQGV